MWFDPWLEQGILFSYRTAWTGYKKDPVIFKRPVGPEFHYASLYGDWSPLWSKHMNAVGLWVVGQLNGKGQHKGLDFAVPEGTLVQAMCDGFVAASGWENPANAKQGFGQRVRHQIVTASGIVMTLVYGHLSQIFARAGQQLHTGDQVGLSGKTGHVSGPHLHTELIDGKGQYHPIMFGPNDPPARAATL